MTSADPRKEGGAGIRRRKLNGDMKQLNVRVRVETYRRLIALAGDESLGQALDTLILEVWKSLPTATT